MKSRGLGASAVTDAPAGLRPLERSGSALLDVPRCPACGSPERGAGFESHDWIHRVPGVFLLVECLGCGSTYLARRPCGEGMRAYYPETAYYSFSTAMPHRLFEKRSLRARAWYAAQRGLLGSRYGYRHLDGSPILGSLIATIPWLRERAMFGLGVLLHPYASDASLLDIGCGSAGYLDLMRALGWSDVTGVDVSERAASVARDALGITVHVGDIRDVRLPSESVHAISIAHTLEHVDDPVSFLSEVRRLLRPDGRIAIVVPNARSLSSRLFGANWVGLETPRHLVNFSMHGLRSVLERAGLRIEALSTSARGSYGVALFSASRALGDPHAVYTNDRQRFPLRRRLPCAALSFLEASAVRLGAGVGELICAVARR